MDFKEYAQLLTESKGNDFKAELIRLFKKDKLVTLYELEEFAKDNG